MVTQAIFLDAAQALIVVPSFFIAHLIGTILIEGGMLYLFKYGNIKKSLLHAFFINLASLAVGLILFDGYVEEGRELVVITTYFGITILIEGIVLWLLDKKFPIKKAIGVNLFMNIITYALLYIILINQF